MNVEDLALTKVSELIAQCSHLQSFITTNDKTPFADGHIDLYEGLKQDREHWRGRVSVQVEGRTRKVKRGIVPNYSVDRVDRLAFQRAQSHLGARPSAELLLRCAINPFRRRLVEL